MRRSSPFSCVPTLSPPLHSSAAPRLHPLVEAPSQAAQQLTLSWNLLQHGHGDSDSVVEYKWGKQTVDTITEFGFKDVEFKTYPGASRHHACAALLFLELLC